MNNRYPLSTLPSHHRGAAASILCAAALVAACSSDSGEDTAQQVVRPTVIPPSARADAHTLPYSTLSHRDSRIKIDEDAGSTSSERRFTLRLPDGVNRSSLAVTLNGADVSSKFSSSDCESTGCMAATLDVDPANPKGVLNALVRYDSGHLASGRLRFSTQGKGVAALASAGQNCTPGTLSVDCPAPFLPPTVAFNTLQPNGWVSWRGGWFEIAGTKFPSNPTPANCEVMATAYVAVVLNRGTLQERAGSPHCFTNAADFNTFLATLTPMDLVVGGTTPANPSDVGSVDATPVGGSKQDWANPTSYMVIGAGRQSGGAYEPFNNGSTATPVSATGTLQEDANSNYNFQPSDVVQFAASPNDSANLTASRTSAFTITVPQSQRGTSAFPSGIKKVVFTAPSGADGMWLLQLDRQTLQPMGACKAAQSGTDTLVFAQCGTFYNSDDDSWRALSSALDIDNVFKMNVLVSVGAMKPSNGGGWLAFYKAALKLGVTPQVLRNPQTGASADYSFVGYRQEVGNALTGIVAESSSGLPATSGQTGFMRGVLQRNGSGMFQVSQTSQEPQVVFASKGGLDSSDFALTVAAYQQPVAWPSSDPTRLLPGATNSDQQIAAYRFISNWLMTTYYVKTVSGGHMDDLHYFFTGTLSTDIDYHFKDPADLPFPASGGTTPDSCTLGIQDGQCVFRLLGDSADSRFDQSTFNVVKKQMSLEVQYLTNVMVFLSTGSTNLKDIIASGNLSAGVALEAAAGTIAGSKLFNDIDSAKATPVSFSWQSVLNLVGAIASTVANLEGLGELTPVWNDLSAAQQKGIKGTIGFANTVGSALGVATNAVTLTPGTETQPTLPSAFAKFTATIGDLATKALMQSTLATGFETVEDNLLSDWGRLSMIGPLVTDVDNPVFYSPTQLSQTRTLDALTKGSAQGFYFSLMPAFYSVHYWPSVKYSMTGRSDILAPYVGQFVGRATECYAFYVTPNTRFDKGGLGALQPTHGMWTQERTAGGYFGQNVGGYDLFMIDTPPSNNSSWTPTITDELGDALFSPNQLNIPMMLFVAENGPMRSVWIDASVSNFAGAKANDVCDAASSGTN